MPEYRWMTLKAVEKAVPAMEAEDVSEVARGDTPSTVTKEGFVEAYRATKGSPAKMKKRPATTGTSWAKRRQEFIGRHMGQIRENGEPLFRDGGIPTRRHLGLIAWAYTPPEAVARLRQWYDAGAPSWPERARRNASQIGLSFSAPRPSPELAPDPSTVIPLPDAERTLMVQVYRAETDRKRALQIHGNAQTRTARDLARRGYLNIDTLYSAGSTVHGEEAADLSLTRRGRSLMRSIQSAREAASARRQTGLFGNPRSNGAPGYRSYCWTQEDWRSIKVSSKGAVDYSQKCGAKGTKTKSGKPRLCLPRVVIEALLKDDPDVLKAQARKKARAAKGKRVPWHPLIKELHCELLPDCTDEPE